MTLRTQNEQDALAADCEDLSRAVDHLTDMLADSQGEEKRLRKHRDKYAGLVRDVRKAVTDFVNPSRGMDCMFICSHVQGILKRKD